MGFSATRDASGVYLIRVEGQLIVGSPAVARRPLTPDQLESLAASARNYAARAQRYRNTLERVG